MGSLAKQTVHTGNSIELKIKGTKIGRAQGLDARRSFGTEGVYEIGSIMPQEHVHLRYEGTATLDRFFVRTASLRQLNLVAIGEDVLTTDIIDIEVIDKTTGNMLRVYRGCSISDFTETFRVGAIAGENATFQYLECSDNTDEQGGQAAPA